MGSVPFITMRICKILGSLSMKNPYHTCPRLCEEFKSNYSLDRLYPNSSLRIEQNQVPPESDTTFSGYIPIDQLEITHTKSSGPGGQNVNKVNTKVIVRFNIEKAKWIPEATKEKFTKLHHNSITKGGDFIVTSDKTRMQTLNLADCMDKIRCYISEAAKPPPQDLPETLLLQKQRQERSAAARLREKRLKSEQRRFKKEGMDGCS